MNAKIVELLKREGEERCRKRDWLKRSIEKQQATIENAQKCLESWQGQLEACETGIELLRAEYRRLVNDANGTNTRTAGDGADADS